MGKHSKLHGDSYQIYYYYYYESYKVNVADEKHDQIWANVRKRLKGGLTKSTQGKRGKVL